jgi:hypothetical protein
MSIFARRVHCVQVSALGLCCADSLALSRSAGTPRPMDHRQKREQSKVGASADSPAAPPAAAADVINVLAAARARAKVEKAERRGKC